MNRGLTQGAAPAAVGHVHFEQRVRGRHERFLCTNRGTTQSHAMSATKQRFQRQKTTNRGHNAQPAMLGEPNGRADTRSQTFTAGDDRTARTASESIDDQQALNKDEAALMRQLHKQMA